MEASNFDEIDDGHFASETQLIFQADQYILELGEWLGVDLESKIYEHFFSLFDLMAIAGWVGNGY